MPIVTEDEKTRDSLTIGAMGPGGGGQAAPGTGGMRGGMGGGSPPKELAPNDSGGKSGTEVSDKSKIN